jgi:hypothetical protein
MNHYHLLLVGVFLQLSIKANCQASTDYAVNTHGDTLQGKIKINWMTEKVKLKTNTGTYSISNGDYTTYFIARHKALYEKIATDRSHVLWTRVIERGKINLYEIIQRRARNQTQTTWFIRKNEPVSYTLKRSGIAGNIGKKGDGDIIKEFISDNPVVLNEYEMRSRYTFKNLRHLIEVYNQP